MAQVSVIIPTHNRASMLPRAIESAKTAGQDLEIVVVDDASTDETESICRNLEGIVYLRMERNVGLARARNAGIRKCSGEYLAFLDDDDLRLPGSIDQQAQMLKIDNALSFVYGQVHIGDAATCTPTGEIRPKVCATGDIFWQLIKGNFIYVPSVLVRRKNFEDVGLFARDVPGTEDWDSWLKLSATSDVGASQEPVAIYRDFTRASGQMSSHRPRMCRAGARTQAKALRLPRALAEKVETRCANCAEYMDGLWDDLIKEGYYYLSSGNIRYAALNFIAAVQLRPKRAARVGTMANFIHSIVSKS